jgi:hypothetical protein
LKSNLALTVMLFKCENAILGYLRTSHQLLTERTAAARPATKVVAYFQDINVVGPALAAAPAFEALAADVRKKGLNTVPCERAMYSPE